MRRQLQLPVDALVPDILASLKQSPNLLIETEPGAGKTTRIPVAILGSVSGQVLVLEPRRIAARMAARRVAWELSEDLGQTVGYQVRLERVAGPRTRLHFLTEGVLTRRLLSDPDLLGIDAVILDEFHERHLETDLALALLKRLQQTRPELHIIVMSATLDTAPVAHFLGDCPVLRGAGRLFDLQVEHAAYSAAPLHEQVKDALEQYFATKRLEMFSSSSRVQPRFVARLDSANRCRANTTGSCCPCTGTLTLRNRIVPWRLHRCQK